MILLEWLSANIADALQTESESATSDDRLESVQNYLEENLAGRNPEGYSRVIFYLLNEIKENPYDYRTMLNYLFRGVISDRPWESMELMIDQVVTDTKTSESDSMFKKIMDEVYELMLNEDNSPSQWKEVVGESGSLSKPEDYVAVTTYMVQAMSKIPKESWSQLFQTLEADVTGTMLTPLAQAGATISEAGGGGTLATVKLIAARLSWETIRNIYMWWDGEISGTRCAKNIMAELTATAGGVAGGYLGSTVGFYIAGPLGAMIGGLGGGILSYSAMSNAADRFLLDFFDLPRDYALENAYNFLGVHRNAENALINQAYRRLARKYHPDMKGGDNEMFIKLQLCMQVIKAQRGE